MGRTKIYATPEEAHEAKKKQMRENYQKRKAAKLAERAFRALELSQHG